jgi:ArsR family transcriptional regulator, arsenate/arsenite/antimonite-responsive transcriptional repressor
MNEVFRALADPTRREILRLLRQRAMSAGEIADRFPQSRSTLSGHFGVLKAADLVQTSRHAQTIVYSLNLSVFEEVAAVMLDLFAVGQTRPARRPRPLRPRRAPGA